MKIILLIILTLFMHSCNECKETYNTIIYKGYVWDVVKINDSIYTIVPGLNSNKGDVPIVININNQELKLTEKQ